MKRILTLLLLAGALATFLAVGAPVAVGQTSPNKATPTHRGWHLQMPRAGAVWDLYLNEVDGKIVEGFLCTTDRDPFSSADVSELSLDPGGRLHGTLRLTPHEDVIARLAAARDKRPFEDSVKPLTMALDVKTTEKQQLVGAATIGKEQLPVRGHVKAMTQDELANCVVELYPLGLAWFPGPVKPGMLLRFLLRNGRVAEVAALSSGGSFNPPRHPWKVEFSQTLFDGARLKATIKLTWKGDLKSVHSEEYVDKGPIEGTLELEGTVIGSAVVGSAQWKGTPELVKTTFRARISHAKKPMQMDYRDRTWDVKPAAVNMILAARAAKEALAPLRVDDPMWNGRLIAKKKYYAIYAPTLAFSRVDGAVKYLVRVEPEKDLAARAQSFESAGPTISLAPIWDKLPPGKWQVSAVGVDGSGGEVGAAKYPEQIFQFDGDPTLFGWEHPFRQARAKDSSPKKVPALANVALVKRASFQGPYYDHARLPEEAALSIARNLRDHGQHRHYRGLGSRGVADDGLHYTNSGESGSAMSMSAFIQACCVVARLTDDPIERDETLRMAERIGWILVLQNKNAIPHTYHDYTVNVAWIGNAWLHLHQQNPDERWSQATLNLARQLASIQKPSGGWMGLSAQRTQGDHWYGGVFGPSEFKEMDPSSLLHFFARVRQELKTDEFAEAETRGNRWVMKNSVPKMLWQNVGNHSGEVTPIQDSVAPHALSYCRYLLDGGMTNKASVELASDIARWCEDRHVDWSRNAPPNEVRPSCWGWSRAAGLGNQITARLAYISARLGQETGDPLWTAKAESLIQGIIAATDPETGANNALFRRTTGEGTLLSARWDYSETADLLDLARRIVRQKR